MNEGGLYPGGFITGIIYSLANGWTWFFFWGGGGLKTGGDLKVGFYGS